MSNLKAPSPLALLDYHLGIYHTPYFISLQRSFPQFSSPSHYKGSPGDDLGAVPLIPWA